MIDLQGSVYRDDDGTADPMVRDVLASGDGAAIAVALRESRLLVAVVARVDSADGSEKDSHMAVVSLVNERGERGMLAFTGMDSLTAWDPQARPVPADARTIAAAALADGAHAVVVDVAGPYQVVITRDVLAGWCADTRDLGA